MARLYKILIELSHRKVIRTLGAYVVIVWLLAQGVADLFPAFGLPEWSVRLFVILAILGIPLVLLLSWRFDLTREGLVRDPGGNPVTPMPPDVLQWAKSRHDGVGAGYVMAEWLDADGVAQQKQFYAPFVIGRDPAADIQLTDKLVSRIHSVIWAENGHWYARDLDSSNGTFVDDERITTSPLPTRCKLRMHKKGPVVDVAIHPIDATVIPGNTAWTTE